MTQPPDGPGVTSVEAHEVTRRSFLRRGGVVGGTALVVAAGGLGYRAYDEGVFQTGQGGAYDAWRVWNDQRGPMALVAAAILAANPHNTQPWLFRVSAQRIELFSDRSRNIGAVDPFDREMYVGLGCALENVMLAAEANGYRANLRLLPSPGQPVHAATVAISPGPGRRSELYEQIPRRHTDRTAYTQQALQGGDLQQMTALAADLPDTRLYWFTSDADRRRIGELMVAAAQALTHDRQQSLDDNRWFRHDWDAIQRSKDGLTIDAQGLPELTTAIAKMLPATSRQFNDSFWATTPRHPNQDRRRLRHHRRPRPTRQPTPPQQRAAAGAHPPVDRRTRTLAGAHEPDHRARRPRTPARPANGVRRRVTSADPRPRVPAARRV